MRRVEKIHEVIPSSKRFNLEIQVAVPSPVPGTFTYKADGPVTPGTRVLVPFGRQKLVGIAMAKNPGEKTQEIPNLKSIFQVLDDVPIFTPAMLKLAQWMADYYLYPIGEVLRTMLPGSTVKSKKSSYQLNLSVFTSTSERENPVHTELRQLFGKRRSLSQAVLLKKLSNKTSDSAPEMPAARLARYVKSGYLSLVEEKKVRTRKIVTEQNDSIKKYPTDSEFIDAAQIRQQKEDALQLTECQRKAMLVLQRAFDFRDREKKAPTPILLFGITGSGKTELYLRSIARLIHSASSSDAPNTKPPQVLMLVPEISLTPQMTRVFATRFPDQVAVVHSAMRDEERWAELRRIREGEATILIGPRSAVFAPFSNLQLIIVDEEHDGSYKQASGLHYNGRDVAIMRAQIESCVTLLGSATPALESFHNGLTGKYEMVELVERASRRDLPEIRCLASRPVFSKGAIMPTPSNEKTYHSSYWPAEIESVPVPIDPEIIDSLRQNQKEGKQSIVLVNRRGYAFFLFSPTRRETMRCPNCAISLTLHKRSAALHCHYCDFKEPIITALKRFPNETFVAIGYGSEKTEESLRVLLSDARIERLDSDTATDRDALASTLERFRRREVDVLVGTQILAKGHDFPGVTLVAVLDVDQSLDLPDFRAGERAFQLIVQSAGRAGRGSDPGQVLLQCSRTGHPVIASASAQNYRSFASYELGFRQAHGYPPFGKMIAIEFNSEDIKAIDALKSRLQSWTRKLQTSRPDLSKKVRLLGPSPPPLELVRGRHRLHFLFLCPDRAPLWAVVKALCEDFKKLPAQIRMLVDVDPQSLL